MSLKKKRFKYFGESLIEGSIKLTATIAIIAVFLIFIFIMRESLPIFFNGEVRQEITFGQFFKGIDWRPVSDNPRFSLWPIILGSLKVTLIALMLAVPVAISAALYSSEFAGRR